jgi:tetratricopeptide (TPR) repeat protein
LLLLRTAQATDRDQALALVSQNLRSNPDSIEDQGLKAAILSQCPDGCGEAIRILEQGVGTDRLGPKERFLLAQLYLNRQDDAKYKTEMLKLLGLKIKNPQHLAHFVNFWLGLNQLDQAERWLAELKKADPRGQPALPLEARLLALRNRKSELLALLETRGREMPDEIGRVAQFLEQYGFAQQAEACYKAFIARDPKQPERLLTLAAFLARQNRVAEALPVLSQAWSTCPHEQVAFAALKVYDAPSADDRHRAQVKAWLIEALEEKHDAVLLESKLGTIMYLEGRFDEAEATYRRVLERHPDDVESLNGLAWILAIRDSRRTEEALEYINRAVESRGNLPALVDTRGVVLMQASQFDKAVQDIRMARAAEPTNANYSLHLAWAFHSSGNTAEARREFREAERLGLTTKIHDPFSKKVVAAMRQAVNRN